MCYTVYPASTKHLYEICTTLSQRLWRSDIAQMSYKCFVFAVYMYVFLNLNNIVQWGDFCEVIYGTWNDIWKETLCQVLLNSHTGEILVWKEQRPEVRHYSHVITTYDWFYLTMCSKHLRIHGCFDCSSSTNVDEGYYSRLTFWN